MKIQSLFVIYSNSWMSFIKKEKYINLVFRLRGPGGGSSSKFSRN